MRLVVRSAHEAALWGIAGKGPCRTCFGVASSNDGCGLTAKVLRRTCQDEWTFAAVISCVNVPGGPADIVNFEDNNSYYRFL